MEENFKRIAQAIGFRYENMVTSNQTHTTNVRKITEKIEEMELSGREIP